MHGLRENLMFWGRLNHRVLQTLVLTKEKNRIANLAFKKLHQSTNAKSFAAFLYCFGIVKILYFVISVIHTISLLQICVCVYVCVLCAEVERERLPKITWGNVWDSFFPRLTAHTLSLQTTSAVKYEMKHYVIYGLEEQEGETLYKKILELSSRLNTMLTSWYYTPKKLHWVKITDSGCST